jgi:CubicO group peptidase (beta-lactamase class C family)
MTRGDAVAALRSGVIAQMELAGLASCQYALAVDGAVVIHETLGAPADARFVIMSATKPVVASVIWKLIGDGKLDSDRPVASWWPEFAANGKAAVTLEHVLLHTAGISNAELSEPAWSDRAQRVTEMETWSLDWEPGSQFAYSGFAGHWVLVELIARVTGVDFRAAIRELVLDPLGLDRLELGVPLERQGDVQKIHNVGEFPSAEEIATVLPLPVAAIEAMLPGLVAGQTSTHIFTTPDVLAAGVPGAGGVTDAASLALFYQHLLHDPEGVWDADVLHDVKTNVRVMMPDRFGGPAWRTLGLETAGGRDATATKRIGAGVTSPATFGHSGAGGQIAFADPASGLSFVFLTNSFDNNFLRNMERDRTITELAAHCAPSA